MTEYIIPYTVTSMVHPGVPQDKYNNLFIEVKEGEDAQKIISKSLESIANNPKTSDFKVQAYPVRELGKEIKLDKYIFEKKGIYRGETKEVEPDSSFLNKNEE